MLKKFRNILFIPALGIVLLQGCAKKDVIDLRPEFVPDAVSNPNTFAEVGQLLLGAYQNLRQGSYYGSGSGTGAGWALMPDVLSDNLYETIESLANSRTMADLQYNTSTAQVSAIWNAPYRVISSVNIVLRDIDKYITPDNQEEADAIKGQAYALRAMAHFDLFRYFAESFDRNSTSILAVPYITEFKVSLDLKPARINNKEFYDLLFADLQEAVSYLGNVTDPINPAGNTRPFIDLAVAYSIQARAFLYAGMWAEAETAATSAIALHPLVNLNQAAYSGMYNETNVGEIIWNVQFESNQSGPTFLVYFATNERSYFRPSAQIATVAGNTGLIQSNDIRYNAFFQNKGGRLALTKYKGKGSISDGNANFVVFKTGELYLIRAEARARNNKEALANDDLDALRAARITGYVPGPDLTGAALLNAIADERRRELVGEGHRFFDLKRTTRTLNRGPECGDPSISPTGVCSLAPTDREWALPIPESETDVNEIIQQNTGY
jgi:starch-binding outer membrane protein, SusD/RagB family